MGLTWLRFLAQTYTMAHQDRKDAQSFGWLGLALLILVQLVLLWPFRHYVTDDTYIHLQFARNLAAGQGLSFHPGEPVYGFTSPLWVLLLAAGDRLGCDGLFLSRALGLLFTFGSVIAVHALGRVWIPDRFCLWMATLAWALDAWLLRWALSGMDTSLGVFLVASGFFFHARARRDRTSSVPGMALFSLSALARPECLALCLLAWLDASFWGVPGGSGDHRARGRSLVEATVPPLLLLLPWLLYAGHTFGRIVPGSVVAKSLGFADTISSFLGTLGRELVLLGATRGIELLLLAVVSFLLLLRLLRGRLVPGELRDGYFRYRLAIAWLLVLLLGYALRDSVLVSRYVLLVGPSTVVLAWAGAAHLLRRAYPGLVFAAGVAVALSNLGILYGLALPHTREFTAGLDGSIGEIADWLRENTPAETTVASPDIGLLGFRSGRRVIDLSGLVTPDLVPLFEGRRIEDFLSEMGFASRYRPDYLIDRATEPERLPQRGPHGERLEVVLVREIGPLGIARREPYYYTLYRVDWSEVPREFSSS